MTISEISSKLDTAIKTIENKRVALETTKAAHLKAASDFDNAIIDANKLRDNLNEELNKFLPSNAGRVRSAA
jgi:hypothetical protein